MIGIRPLASRGNPGGRRTLADAVWRAVALVAILTSGACASGASEASGAGDATRAAAEGSPNVLSGDALRETAAANVWDALRQLRPQWLRARAAASLIPPEAAEPIVYLHGIRHGPLRTLQRMNIDQVRRVEFLDGPTATTRFGTGHGGGVILVDLDRS